MENDSEFQNLSPADARSARDLLHALVAAGHSNTRPRRAMIRVLVAAQAALDAEAILRRAREHHPRLGTVTVYRTLELLERLGVVRRIHQEDGCHTYALSALRHGHHLICQRCDQAIEFAGCNLDGMIARLSRQTGFLIQDHWLELFGICPTCQQHESARPRASE